MSHTDNLPEIEEGVISMSKKLTVMEIQEFHVLLRFPSGHIQWFDKNSDTPLKIGDEVTLKVIVDA